jgi:hypothetical protein
MKTGVCVLIRDVIVNQSQRTTINNVPGETIRRQSLLKTTNPAIVGIAMANAQGKTPLAPQRKD